MAVINTHPGAPLTISIGKKGFRPDFYAARIVGAVRTVRENGRTNQVAPVIYEAKNLAGETYLAERPDHNLAFAIDREELCPLLDGSMNEPKPWQELVKERAKGLMAFLMTLPEDGQVVEVDQLGI